MLFPFSTHLPRCKHKCILLTGRVNKSSQSEICMCLISSVYSIKTSNPCPYPLINMYRGETTMFKFGYHLA